MDDLFANNEEQEDVLFGNLEYDDQNIFSDDHSMFTEIDSDYNRIREEMEKRKIEERNRIKAKEDYYITNFEREKKRNIPIGDIIVYIFLFSILTVSLYMILFK